VGDPPIPAGVETAIALGNAEFPRIGVMTTQDTSDEIRPSA
jgi:hypothetical protein